MDWVPHFDDSTWENDYSMAWDEDGARWFIDEEGGLEVIGDWFVDYRPEILQITFTEVERMEIWLTDFGGNIIGEVRQARSGGRILLNWEDDDLRYIEFTPNPPGGDDAYITNIEFALSIDEGVCTDALDGMLLQVEASEQYLRTMAPSLYGKDPGCARQIKDLNDRIPNLEDRNLARRTTDFFRR